MLGISQEKYLNYKKELHIQEEIRIAVVTWNLEGMLPPQISVSKLMNKIIGELTTNPPDLIAVSTQQCERPLSVSFFCESKQGWQNLINDAVENQYQLIDSETLQGLHTALLVRKDLIECFTKENKSVMRAGACNILGNKGAISLECNLLGQNFQFINCHLAPHQTESEHRNQTLIRIIDNMANKDSSVNVFLCGDLNYRIDLTKQQYFEMIKNKKNTEEQMKYLGMLDKDQLRNQQLLKDRFFIEYEEAPIKFPPTYKMSTTGLDYNPTRIPGWTDRIFKRKGKIHQQSYSCMYNLLGSDHRPVIGTFKVRTQEALSIFPEEFIAVSHERCQLI